MTCLKLVQLGSLLDLEEHLRSIRRPNLDVESVVTCRMSLALPDEHSPSAAGFGFDSAEGELCSDIVGC